MTQYVLRLYPGMTAGAVQLTHMHTHTHTHRITQRYPQLGMLYLSIGNEAGRQKNTDTHIALQAFTFRDIHTHIRAS